MGSHQTTTVTTNEKFEFTAGIRKALHIMMGVGIVGLLLVYIFNPENGHARFWSNILLNTYYFTGISLFGLFIVAAAQLAYGGWHTLIKRVLISMGAFSMIGGFLLLFTLITGLLGWHNLYDHVKHILHDHHNEKYTNKHIFFNPPFWVARVLIYAIAWAALSYAFDKFFGEKNQIDPKVYKQSKLLSALFIVVFAVTESFVSWDMVMSLDPHWYSTLFGWYNFASYGCAGWAMSILLVIFLKSRGYLQAVNENHIHDLGKFLFGFSIFWTYLWFSQFMLQWYGNIPEDTNFWVKRFNTGYFKFTIFLSLIINFLFPLLFLIKRSAKRNFKMIGFGAALLFFGHYIDFFNYTAFEPVVREATHDSHHGGGHSSVSQRFTLLAEVHGEHNAPAEKAPTSDVPSHADVHLQNTAAPAHAPKHESHGSHSHATAHFATIGLGELMIFAGFLGLFLYFCFSRLSKRNLIVENDPYLEECKRLTVTWA
ncbi:MAG: hypothetical protein NZM35_01530 [Chitinophagales bacterium]|nr:hypothetical protein [Chitinophagales bacterium]MDW8418184.1 hypothetical protein [Chitinophagales bacterium]